MQNVSQNCNQFNKKKTLQRGKKKVLFLIFLVKLPTLYTSVKSFKYLENIMKI